MDFNQQNDKARDLVIEAVKLINEGVDPRTNLAYYVAVRPKAHPGLFTLMEFDDATGEHTELATYRIVLERVS